VIPEITAKSKKRCSLLDTSISLNTLFFTSINTKMPLIIKNMSENKLHFIARTCPYPNRKTRRYGIGKRMKMGFVAKEIIRARDFI
jgi:hypothetical protein